MQTIFRLVLFLIVSAAVIVAGFKAYRFFNRKITGSQTGLQLLLYSLLLIVVNMVILIAGLFILLKTYEVLSDV